MSDSSTSARSFFWSRVSSRYIHGFSSITSISTRADSSNYSQHGKLGWHSSKKHPSTVSSLKWWIEGAKSGIHPLECQAFLIHHAHNLISLFMWVNTSSLGATFMIVWYGLWHISNVENPASTKLTTNYLCLC